MILLAWWLLIGVLVLIIGVERHRDGGMPKAALHLPDDPARGAAFIVMAVVLWPIALYALCTDEDE